MATVLKPNTYTTTTTVKENITIVCKVRITKKEQFIAALKRNDIKHEVQEVDSTTTMIGINIGSGKAQGSWHWFEYVHLPLVDFEHISFDHSYSQITGKSKKGVTHRLKMYDRIENATGFTNWY